jgi:RNA polymerase sigma-70 factor, ECF subfamily
MTAIDLVGADPVVSAAMAGDEPAFAALVRRHRRAVQAHCYRMLGSLEEAEDLAQEAFLRAWRRRETFRENASFRPWLFRIATNLCLTALERRRHWVDADLPEHLEPAAPSDTGAEVVAKETVELVLLVAARHLPPRQRAVLFVTDVLGWPARDTAHLLGTSVASVNSALQRARTTLRMHLPERLEWHADAA